MIDTHAHLHLYPKNIEGLIQRALKSNVKAIIDICTDIASLKNSFLLKKTYPFIHTAAATAAQDLFSQDFFEMIKESIKEKKLIAIGETGLDYYYKHIDKKTQKKTFLKYLTLANEKDLPLIIHCREAFFDIFPILKNFKNKKILFHCFTGTIKECEEILKNGWNISFSGIITFKNSFSLRECVKITPLKNIFLETDSPYLSPEPYRSKPNEPSFISETFKKVSDIKNLPLETIQKETLKNVKNFFKIDIT